MDLLVTILLLVIGAAIRSGKKKKAAAEQARRQEAFHEASAAEASARAKAGDAAKAIVNELLKLDDEDEEALEQAVQQGKTPKKPEAGQLKIPFTKAEWSAYLKKNTGEGRAPTPEKTAARSAVPADAAIPAEGASAKAAVQAFAASAPRPIMRTPAQHREGEHPRVHAEHQQRIFEEEARLHREREELKELRNVNLKKLRSAVVMSEVLGKPVSLRPRGGR